MKGPVCSHHHYQYDYLWYANFRICKSHDMHFDSSIYSGNSLLKVWVRKCYTLATSISKSGWVYLCLLLLSVHYLALDNNIYVILNFSQQHAHSFSLLFSCHNLRSYIIELIHKILMSHFIFIILIVSFGKFPTFTSVGLTNAPYLGAHSTVPPWTRNSAHHYAYIYIYSIIIAGVTPRRSSQNGRFYKDSVANTQFVGYAVSKFFCKAARSTQMHSWSSKTCIVCVL